ncbi:MAG: sulfoxide reductase heme-binding subunit YedZ [Paracoccaceae bacterium]|jgi:sulfoxide reductase heme-binding subunit YedZ
MTLRLRFPSPVPSAVDLAPWRDRRRRLSALRAAAFALAIAPAVRIAWLIGADALGPEPIDRLIGVTGAWAAVILLAALALTPIRRLTGWTEATGVRRLLGLSGALWLMAHFLLFAADKQWRLGMIASEIVSRTYLTVGAVALLGYVALAATSFDRVIRRIGPIRWRRLHRLAYPLLALGMLHVWMQVRLADYIDALLMSGALAWLLAFRVAGIAEHGSLWRRLARALGLAALAGVAAALAEAAWFHALVDAPVAQVLLDNLSVEYGVSVAIKVALICGGGAVAAVLIGAACATPAGVRIGARLRAL